MFDLEFISESDRSMTVQLRSGGQAVLSGHVFMGDLPHERTASIHLHRPYLLQCGMVEAVRDALIAISGDSAMAHAAVQQLAA